MAVAYLMQEILQVVLNCLLLLVGKIKRICKIQHMIMVVGLFKPKDNTQLGHPWNIAGSSLCLTFKSPSCGRFFPSTKPWDSLDHFWGIIYLKTPQRPDEISHPSGHRINPLIFPIQYLNRSCCTFHT